MRTSESRDTSNSINSSAAFEPEVRNRTCRTMCANFKFAALVGVTLKPSRPGLPLMQLGVIIANRHLDLRQTLFVEYLVLRDHLVQEEQVGRQRIDLIGSESPLIPERHAAIDEIPHRRRKRRAQWQDALPFPDGNILAFFRLQRGRQPPYARCAMAGDARLLLIDLCALLGCAAAGREHAKESRSR